ncbi:MAG: glycogen/starch synthase [Collinsella sp.]
MFLREFYQGLPLYDRVKTVFSIHNVAFQGQFSDTVMEDILGGAHSGGRLAAALRRLQHQLHAGRCAMPTPSPR